jgi:hypothetical protein
MRGLAAFGGPGGMMSSLSQASARPAVPIRWRAKLGLFEIAALFAVVISIFARFHSGLFGVLWLDETWTGAIAGQSTPRDLLYQIYNDVNAPLYYVVMCIWVKFFGLSNFSLRFPNVIFGVLAALAAWGGGARFGRGVAAAWCILLASWGFGLLATNDARCYTLLLFASSLSVVAFAVFVAGPTARSGLAWVAVSSLAVLTHYHAVFLVAGQAAVLLLLHRRDVLRLWPILFGFVPAVAWCLFHLPRIAMFARPEIAWYAPLTTADAPRLAMFLAGMPIVLVVGLVVLVMAIATALVDRKKIDAGLSPLAWACAASLVGMALCLAVAAIRPSFIQRYLTPFVPGVLLGLAVAASYASTRYRTAPLLLIVSAFAVLVIFLRLPIGESDYSFEKASYFLREGHPQKLVFLWDHPANSVEAPGQLKAVGGFFFNRARDPIQVDPVYLKAGDDPNQVLLSRAGPRSAILWIYDLKIHDTAAKLYPPHIAEQNPDWRCRNFARGGVGIFACRRGA